MKRELVVAAGPGELRAVLSEDGTAVELAVERDDEPGLLGAIFLGRIERCLPGLPGCFVTLGAAGTGFLPGLSLPGGVAPVEGAALLVQVAKEGFADKPPELTAAPSLDGRLVLWTPGRPGVAASRALAPEEAARLRGLALALLGPGEGAVVRRQAAGAGAAALRQAVERVRAGHAELLGQAAAATAPSRLDAPRSPLERVLAWAGGGLDRVLIDDRAAFAAARHLLGPAGAERLELDLLPGFDRRHGLDEAFAAALAAAVPLDGGGRLTIEAAEAFTAIDVDLAQAAGGRIDAAKATRDGNLDAALAIPRELRRRGIGGAIVVDFISMRSRGDRSRVEAALAAAAAADPVPVELHGWTRLGHYELTRRRAARPLAERLLEPAGGRRGKTPATVAFELLRAAAGAAARPGPAILHLHPAVAALLCDRLAAALAAAQRRAGRELRLAPDPARPVESFDIGGA